MRKIENDIDLIDELMQSFNPPLPGKDSVFTDKVFLDIGCGTGRLVRTLAEKGAIVYGIDQENMLAKAKAEPLAADETYISGKAEELPFDDRFADVILYFASFHHIPYEDMNRALNHCRRVLKESGIAIFIEPIGEDGSYFELAKLVVDERDIQAKVYKVIQNADSESLEHKHEEIVYSPRSYEDFLNLLETFVDDVSERNRIKQESFEKAQRLAKEAGVTLEDFRLKSIYRINVLQKI